MTSKSHRIEIGAICIAVILLSLWGIVWDISSGLLTSGIDGIMLLLIALMMGGIFSLMFAHLLWQAGLLPFSEAEACRCRAGSQNSCRARETRCRDCRTAKACRRSSRCGESSSRGSGRARAETSSNHTARRAHHKMTRGKRQARPDRSNK